MLTRNETYFLRETARRIATLRNVLAAECPTEDDDAAAWYRYLATIRSTLGNLSNSISFVATMLAKRHLEAHFGVTSFDAAAKPQGAPGLDIDVTTPDGRRIVAEVKTTGPYLPDDFGAQQKKTIEADFRKLNQAVAAVKFLFVTDRRAFEILNRKYAHKNPSVEVILLTVES